MPAMHQPALEVVSKWLSWRFPCVRLAWGRCLIVPQPQTYWGGGKYSANDKNPPSRQHSNGEEIVNANGLSGEISPPRNRFVAKRGAKPHVYRFDTCVSKRYSKKQQRRVKLSLSLACVLH